MPLDQVTEKSGMVKQLLEKVNLGHFAFVKLHVLNLIEIQT